jgi:branched-subunit amino acid transport protein
MNLVAILVLAVGTYAFRATGPILHDRLQLTDRVKRLLSVSATVLLVALVATSALAAGHGFAGWARPAGVLVGGVLALRRLPFLLVVTVGVATTAGLRLLGVR